MSVCVRVCVCVCVCVCVWGGLCLCVCVCMHVAKGNLSSTWTLHCLFMPSKLKCASLRSSTASLYPSLSLPLSLSLSLSPSLSPGYFYIQGGIETEREEREKPLESDLFSRRLSVQSRCVFDRGEGNESHLSTLKRILGILFSSPNKNQIWLFNSGRTGDREEERRDIYIYSFSRRFYPKPLPKESFTKCIGH